MNKLSQTYDSGQAFLEKLHTPVTRIDRFKVLESGKMTFPDLVNRILCD